MAKSALELSNQILNDKQPQSPRRSIRDLDDHQSYLFPDVTAQEFIDGLKSGKINYHELQKKGDSALFDNLGDAVRGELNLTPQEYGDLINQNYKLNKVNNTFEWNKRYLDEFNKWNEGGRPKTSDSDWAWDFFGNYAPNGYLRWYRPQEQWGQADKLHAIDEWNDKFDPEGNIHDGFNPYKAGYAFARESWDNFFKKYGNDIVNPRYKKILEWLDKNKEWF